MIETTETTDLRIDAKFSPQGRSWVDVRDASVAIDSSKLFEGVWFFDHLESVRTGPNGSESSQPIFEGWSLLSAIASITSNVRLGLMVSCLQYRPLGVLAKIVSTIDNITGGRVDLGLGAGNNANEAKAFGIPFPSLSDRIAILAESCEALKLLFSTDQSVTYDGNFVKIENAKNNPAPVNREIPFFIGGKGEVRMFKVIAEHADFWNYSNGTPEEFSQKYSKLVSRSKELSTNRRVPRASVQVQVSPSDLDGPTNLATSYIKAGASHILLYAVPSFESVEGIKIVAERLRQ